MTSPGVSPLYSMLLTFRATNFRSFREQFEFSLISSSLSRDDAVREIPWRQLPASRSIKSDDSATIGEKFGSSSIGVLPSAGIFGPNASGKSNVLMAMDHMRGLVMNSFIQNPPNGKILRWPFLLDEESKTYPTRYEIDLVLNGIRHVYGFEFNDDSIIEEWAYRFPNGRASRMFHRRSGAIVFGSAQKAQGRAVEKLLRVNALFLSTAAQANYDLLNPLFAWFVNNLVYANEATRPIRQRMSFELFKRPEYREQVLSLLRAADLGISGIVEHNDEGDLKIREAAQQFLSAVHRHQLGVTADEIVELPNVEFLNVSLVHQSEEVGEVELMMASESLGTLVWLGLVGPVVGALINGTVLLADELDASLHPSLAIELIELFQSPESNPNGAQIVFNSHDPTMLGGSDADRLLGLDQIWFTEKLNDGTSRLFPLTDLNPRRRGESIEKRYLAGLYGAVPILSRPEFQFSVNRHQQDG